MLVLLDICLVDTIGILVDVLCFFWYTWYDLEYLSLNKNDLIIQTHHSKLVSYFAFIFFVLFSYIFAGVVNKKVLKSNLFVQTFWIYSLWQVKNKIVWFIDFTVFCVHNCLISFFIACSAENSICYKSISYFIFLSTSSMKLEWKVLCHVVAASLLSQMSTPIIMVECSFKN